MNYDHKVVRSDIGAKVCRILGKFLYETDTGLSIIYAPTSGGFKRRIAKHGRHNPHIEPCPHCPDRI